MSSVLKFAFSFKMCYLCNKIICISAKHSSELDASALDLRYLCIRLASGYINIIMSAKVAL